MSKASSKSKDNPTAVLETGVVRYGRFKGSGRDATVEIVTPGREVFSFPVLKFHDRATSALDDPILTDSERVEEAANLAVNVRRAFAERSAVLADDPRMHSRNEGNPIWGRTSLSRQSNWKMPVDTSSCRAGIVARPEWCAGDETGTKGGIQGKGGSLFGFSCRPGGGMTRKARRPGAGGSIDPGIQFIS